MPKYLVPVYRQVAVIHEEQALIIEADDAEAAAAVVRALPQEAILPMTVGRDADYKEYPDTEESFWDVADDEIIPEEEA